MRKSCSDLRISMLLNGNILPQAAQKLQAEIFRQK